MTTVVTPWPADGSSSAVPRDLAVVVGVDVDEAGGDDEAGGVDRLGRLALDATLPAHLDDDAVLHRHVAHEAVAPRAVHDGPVPDHQVVHDPPPLRSALP